MKNTPPLRARGRYVLRNPWVANPGKLYTNMAIRTFEDVYELGTDVYETYYVPMGLANGTVVGGTPFSFATERNLQPNIITLEADDGEIIYVPDTFIQSYPNMGEVKYSHVILAVTLGALPDNNDLSYVKDEIQSLVAQIYGVNATVQEARAPSTGNPTAIEHEALEAARAAAITLLETDRAKALRLQAEKTLLQGKINTLLAILRANNIPLG
jgi:hypothetical protein